ncbi:serine/threonine-protein kinase [Chondromyces apiculatus]|uniref:non-specific serine/threonine protein kinase n=1 Tax=Chondromyces apiculatus DSM 436 TaxID=1192034 RepID=A0A017TJ54_9BACT|nr:serine/threonine-protein kinase [Chondromyces apiculatus]EYF08922.1 serine/threonine protein kinase [Chondromyces apiculatus DSM 436]
MNGNSTVDHVPGATTGLVTGDTVGPYELLFQAAEGGMATIWAARRRGVTGADDIVAVKVLSDVLREDPEGRAMFLDEARTAARIVHPNICRVLDYGEDRGQLYLAMEWIEGESLARLDAAQRARGGRLPTRWVLHVAAAACIGLHAAHEARDADGELLQLVHRDVSPQNVMVTTDGRVKIVDFGVAKSRRRAQITRVGVIKGKTGYFSPEQIAGHEIDRRSDIFSFGIMLYVLCTDHHPFRGRSAIETVQNIASRVPFSPRELVPDMPRTLDALIMRALAKDPADRFDSTLELGRVLELINHTLGDLRASHALTGTSEERTLFSHAHAAALVHTLLPGSSEERRERIVRTAAQLDEARHSAPRSRTGAHLDPCSETPPHGTCDDDDEAESTPPSFQIRLSIAEAKHQEATRVEGQGTARISSVGEPPPEDDADPISSAPADLMTLPAAPDTRGRGRPLGLLSLLALLAASALVTRAGEEAVLAADPWEDEPPAHERARSAPEITYAAVTTQPSPGAHDAADVPAEPPLPDAPQPTGEPCDGGVPFTATSLVTSPRSPTSPPTSPPTCPSSRTSPTSLLPAPSPRPVLRAKRPAGTRGP